MSVLESEGRCKTPNNEDGFCISLDSCPTLMAILQEKPVNTQHLDYLQKSNCGFVGSVPNVCCPSLLNSDREATTRVQYRPSDTTTYRPRTTTYRTTTYRPRTTEYPAAPPIEQFRPRPTESEFRPKPSESPASAFGGNSYLLPTLDYCGQDSSNRIIGGENTEVDEFPWMALLEYKKRKLKKYYLFISKSQEK